MDVAGRRAGDGARLVPRVPRRRGAMMMDAVPPLTVRGVRKKYRRRVVLSDVSFDVLSGEAVALVGPNGAGKSTLIGCVTADRLPDAGAVRICGADPFADPAKAAACL